MPACDLPWCVIGAGPSGLAALKNLLEAVVPLGAPGHGWEVRAAGGEARRYAVVVVASGHNHVPRWPRGRLQVADRAGGDRPHRGASLAARPTAARPPALGDASDRQRRHPRADRRRRDRASVRVSLVDRDVPSYFKSLEHLLRYWVRPAFALERLSLHACPDGGPERVRYALPRHNRSALEPPCLSPSASWPAALRVPPALRRWCFIP